MGVKVHPTALVESGAELGVDVEVGPYCLVESGAQVGDGTVLGAFSVVKRFVRLGKGCRVGEHVVLGGEPQDLSFRGERSWVIIGDGVVLREFVTVHRGTGEDSETRIGDGSYLMEGVHVGHNAQVGKNVVMASKVGLSGFSQVGDGAVLGGMSGLHQFVRVGRLCMVGGLTKVVKDVPPFCLVDGHPARIYGLNKVGLRRAGFTSEERLRAKRIYDALRSCGLPLRQAAAKLLELFAGDPLCAEVFEFISASKRGITPFCGGGVGLEDED